MPKKSLFLVLVICAMGAITAQSGEMILPAGTLLRCTLDEPNFSSRSAEIGDPIICSGSSVRQFERDVFPLGVYVAGRFEDYRDPGRFVGKGWIKLEFDRLVLPGKVVPISARVISVDHFKVDRDGKILGRGHPKRDAVGWAIPVLWPVKAFTLPLRGPLPTLQEESRVTLKLVDDISIWEGTREEGLRPGKSTPSVTNQLFPAKPRAVYENSRASIHTGSSGTQVVAGGDVLPTNDPDNRPGTGEPPQASRLSGVLAETDADGPKELTLLFLKDGRGYAVTDYWCEAGALRYTTSGGAQKFLPLAELDLAMTVRLNGERGVKFVLQSRPENR